MSALAASEPTNLWEWLGDSSQRAVSGPIPELAWSTLWHALLAAAIATLLAVPAAALLAHARKAELLSGWIVNIGRVIPTITVLGFAVLISLRNGYGFEPWPIVFALIVLALPPLFANTYTAVRDASPDVVAAARAMGLTERQVLLRVELPLALPLLVATLRTTTTQLVATEALAALFGGGGLGLYIRFGLAQNDIYEVQAGALLVAGLAMAVDLTLWLVGRLVVPRSLRAADRRSDRRRRARPQIFQPTPVPGGSAP